MEFTTYLMKFEDGPLADRAGVMSLAGPAHGVLPVSSKQFSWPLPDRIGVRENGEKVQVWNAYDQPIEDGALYVKVGESQLDRDAPHLARGATYRVFV